MGSLRDAIRRAAWWSSTPSGFAWLFVAGLLIRLALARGGGFPVDMQTFSAWAEKLAAGGLGSFYADPKYFVDYPPGYMYVLWAIGKITPGGPSVLMLKAPGMLADLGLAWVVAQIASRLAPRSLRTRFPVRGVAAAAILLNPGVFFVSAVWGQVDSVQALLVLTGFLLLGTGAPTLTREALSMVVLSGALVTKPQAAFVIPIAVLILVWRHVRGAVAEGRGIWPALARVGGLALVALGFALVVMLPFKLGLGGCWQLVTGQVTAEQATGCFLRFYTKAASTYPYTSVWAFNFWGAWGFWRPDAGAKAVSVLGVPALYAGLAALGAGTVAILALALRALRRGEDEGRVLVFGGVALTCLAFAVMTRIHERYLFLALAALAPLVAYRTMRRILGLLSLLYLANVWFPYVYYVEFAKRKAIRLGPLFNLLYGTAQDSGQKKLLSLFTGGLCLFVAWRGWRWLESRHAEVPEAEAPPAAAARQPQPRPSKWTLDLHPVGRRGAAAAAAAFVLVATTRLVGLGSPHGMYFDEVYHARTAGEYLQGREVYEWTHPPLAKEIMALSIRTTSRYGVHGRGRAPSPAPTSASSDGRAVAWTAGSTVRSGAFGEGCSIEQTGRPVRIAYAPDVVVAAGAAAIAGGVGPQGPSLTKVENGAERWTAILPSRPASIAMLDGNSFVLTDRNELVLVTSEGKVSTVASGAGGMAVAAEDHFLWVSIPETRKVAAYAADGIERADKGAQVQGRPGALGASAEADRVLVADDDRPRIELVDTELHSRSAEELALKTEAFTLVPDSGLVWAREGRTLRAIEPRSFSVMGTVTMPKATGVLLPDQDRNRLVAMSGSELYCVGGRAQFGWRFGSAVFGSAAALFAFLIALRLFGSIGASWLAAAFVALDGLAFTLSRIAMNDAYVTTFILGAWFCALSCLYRWRRKQPPAPEEAEGEPVPEPVTETSQFSRRAALAWLAATGVFAGAALASKWVGLYGLGGIGLLFLWDFRARGRAGTLSIAGHPLVSIGVIGLCLVVLPLGVYTLSYIPYFSLGHSFTDLLKLQKGMYDYHAHLTASHPYGSPWYGWPVGRRAVYLYLSQKGADQAQIWTLANPVVFLGGLAGIFALLSAAWRRRAAALAIVPAAALVQYLPWTTVSRVTFLYHYLPVVPFLAIGLGWWLVIGRKGARLRNAEIAAVVGGAALLFLVGLPMTDGWHVAPSYHSAIRNWLSWIF